MKQKLRYSLSAIVLAALGGCSAEIGDLMAYTQQVRANTQVNIEPYPEFETQPTFKYTASEMRSPFVRPRIAEQAVVETVQANCLQPNFNRRKQPLESYGIDAIAMSGVFQANGRNYVLFKTNDGMLHKATYGNYIGLFHGKITTITNQTVKITELLPDGAGCWQQKETELTMASLAGENDNV